MSEIILYPGAGQPFTTYGDAKVFIEQYPHIVNPSPEQMDLLRIANAIMAQTPLDSDRLLILSMGDCATSSEGNPF